MIFELAQDFHEALAAMPKEHPRRRILGLLEEAIRMDLHFINCHSTTLFQCMWNNCWWYDSPEAQNFHEEPTEGWSKENAPWSQDGEKLYRLLENWRTERQESVWIRSLHPPNSPLGSKLMGMLEGHDDAVTALAFSADSGLLVTGSEDKTLCLWDMKTGKCRKIQTKHKITAVALSPDAKLLASAFGFPEETLCIWSTETGQCLDTYSKQFMHVDSIAFSPDGALFASAGKYSREIIVWSVETGECTHKLQAENDISSIAFNPDGRLIVAAADSISVWDIKNEKRHYSLEGSTGLSSRVMCSPVQNLVASGVGNTVRVWDMQSGKCIRTFWDKQYGVTSLAFDPSGNLLASGSQADHPTVVRLWNVHTGVCLHVLEDHTSTVNSVEFSPDGRMLASASDDRTVCIWDVEAGQCMHIIEKNNARAYCVAWPKSNTGLFAGYSDNCARMWDIRTWECVREFQGHNKSVSGLTASPDGKFLATGSFDNTVRLWDVQTGHQCFSWELQGWIGALAFNNSGTRIAVGLSDGTILIWVLSTGKCEFTLHGHSHVITSIAFSHDDRHFISTSPDSLRIWESERGECRTILQNWIRCLSAIYSPDDTMLALGGSGIHICDPETGQSLCELGGHGNAVTDISFSSDGDFVTSSSKDKTVILWEVNTGQRVRIFDGHESEVTSVAFSPDDTCIASGTKDNKIYLWRPHFGQNQMRLKARTHYLRISDFTCSYDGSVFATTSGTRAFVWTSTGGLSPVLLDEHLDDILQIVISSDGSRLASLSRDDRVRIWNTQSGTCLYTERFSEDASVTMDFDPKGRLLAIATDEMPTRGTVTIVSVGQIPSESKWHQLSGHSDNVERTVFSPDGNLLACSSKDHTVWLWCNLYNDPNDWECCQILQHPSTVYSMCFSSCDFFLASLSIDRIIRIWDSMNGNLIAMLESDGRDFKAAFSPNGVILATLAHSEKGTIVRLWDIKAAQIFRQITGATDVRAAAAFASGHYSHLLVCYGKSNDALIIGNDFTLAGYVPYRIVDCATPDGYRWLTCSTDKIHIFEVEPQ